MNKSVLLKLLGCTLILGIFNCQASSNHQSVGEDLEYANDNILIENNSIREAKLKEARRSLNLANNDLQTVIRLSQSLNEFPNDNDNNIKESTKNVLEGINLLKRIVSDIDNIEIKYLDTQILMIVLRRLNYGLNVLCQNENRVKFYIHNIKVINDIMMLCYNIDKHLTDYLLKTPHD